MSRQTVLGRKSMQTAHPTTVSPSNHVYDSSRWPLDEYYKYCLKYRTWCRTQLNPLNNSRFCWSYLKSSISAEGSLPRPTWKEEEPRSDPQLPPYEDDATDADDTDDLNDQKVMVMGKEIDLGTSFLKRSKKIIRA